MAPPENPFSDYHRAKSRKSFARIAAIGVLAALTVGLVSLVAPAAPPVARELTAASAGVESSGAPTQQQAASTEPGSELASDPTAAVALPAPATPAIGSIAPPPAQPALPTTGAASWTIAVDTTGYQPEIDECLWVRMDLGGHAPIVGAHNYCGGGIVLEMALGDVVTMTGTGLDGRYVVSDARDARAGDTAATAIKGMGGSLILQTCYWSDDGSVRLVGLTPAPII
ncbi:MAG: hypothetical protein LH624_17895 [Cryobacterium sp.]|nr:hypothetical protein [Cryobacterium sp.]